MNAHRSIITQLLVVTVAMFGFGFLLVPLYDVFCEITGFGGKTAGQAQASTTMVADLERTVTVQFVASVANAGEWTFSPVQSSIEVHPGKAYTISYVAENLRSAPTAGQAVPSVSPQPVNPFSKEELTMTFAPALPCTSNVFPPSKSSASPGFQFRPFARSMVFHAVCGERPSLASFPVGLT